MPTWKMSLPDIAKLPQDKQISELYNTIVAMNDRLSWIMAKLDSQNVKSVDTNETVVSSADGTTEIVGPVLVQKDNAGVTRLQQGYDAATGNFTYALYNALGVQTIGVDSNGNATFSGSITASTITGGTITGGTIRTAAVDNARIELSGAGLASYGADNNLTGVSIESGTYGFTSLRYYDESSNRIGGLAYDGLGLFQLYASAGGQFWKTPSTAGLVAWGDWAFAGQVDLSVASVLGLSTDSAGSHTHVVIVDGTPYTTTSAGGHSHSVS
jgi:hypothetical protein